MISDAPDSFFVGGSQECYNLLKPFLKPYATTGHVAKKSFQICKQSGTNGSFGSDYSDATWNYSTNRCNLQFSDIFTARKYG